MAIDVGHLWMAINVAQMYLAVDMPHAGTSACCIEMQGLSERVTVHGYFLHDPTKMMKITLAVYIFLLSCHFAASLVETLQVPVPVRQGRVSLASSSFHPMPTMPTIVLTVLSTFSELSGSGTREEIR